ncbi:MAG: transposase [Thermodesulfobacteriota bacterium]
MPRIARFIRSDCPTVYHVMSRTALPGLPIKNPDKNYLLELIKRFSKLYFVEVLGFAIMGNHFHLVARMHPLDEISDEEVVQRWHDYYGDEARLLGEQVAEVKKRLCSLAAYVKDIKQNFTRYYNKKHKRQGFFWGGRFKSMIVQDGHTLVNLLAYVDLNPIRAGIVKSPEDYRWSSLGYHIQTGNKGELLSLDFGIKEWNEHSPKEIVRKYREFVYETGAVDAGKGAVIEQKIVDKERKKKYKLRRVDRFMYRTRYFTDAGIIGSKEFVGEVFDQVKHLLKSKDERKFTPVGGVEGVYSMKRLGS